MIKRFLRKILPPAIVRSLESKYPRHSPFEGKEMSTVFTDIYERNHWQSEESISGRGAEMSRTYGIRNSLPGLMKDFNITSLCDAPCGDMNWMSQIDLNGIEYTGVDIVPDLILKNQERYQGNEKIRFIQKDLTNDPLPKVDLILNRECLVHFSFDDIRKCLINMKRSQSLYLLTTTFRELKHNHDIITGHWRAINLQKPPFSFPEPLLFLEERCEPGTEQEFEGKGLGLWPLKYVPSV